MKDNKKKANPKDEEKKDQPKGKAPVKGKAHPEKKE